MGLYKRIELMHINGLLDEKCDKHFVYRIECKTNGHYYIGQTTKLKDRLYSHYMKILGLCTDRGAVGPQNVHAVLAGLLAPAYVPTKKLSLEKFIRDSLSVSVIAIVSDKELADFIEKRYIIKAKSDKKCLNK